MPDDGWSWWMARWWKIGSSSLAQWACNLVVRGVGLLFFLLLGLPAALADSGMFVGGHVKALGAWQSYPDNSLLRDVAGAHSEQAGGELRLRFAVDRAAWDVQLDYQLQGRWGDIASRQSLGQESAAALTDDSRRGWDLSSTPSEGGRHQLQQRLDRVNVGYTGERLVLRVGRQAISWGNGLIFNPVDVFNPFDPAAVDTEYKLGDDMLYGQYLFENGSDLQWVRVLRRNENGAHSASVASSALKFHAFEGEHEWDLLVAEHYGETLLALGSAVSLGEALLRADLMAQRSNGEWLASAVVNGSWSWVWRDHNVSGVLEYYFNGVGLREAGYSLQAVNGEGALARRLQRGELFALGRHYLATALDVELTPLLNFSPSVLANLGDRSALLQLALRWDPAQEWQLLAALNLPLGPAGTEYGGLHAGEQALSRGPGIFLQLARYF